VLVLIQTLVASSSPASKRSGSEAVFMAVLTAETSWACTSEQIWAASEICSMKSLNSTYTARHYLFFLEYARELRIFVLRRRMVQLQ